jgi:sulfite exporter TauE/SafE
MIPILLPGFLLGILSGAHCIGMCGPLALALPIGQQRVVRFVVGRLLYNVGRAITYVVLGAAVGMIGVAVPMPGVQRWISICAGVIVILFSLIPRINAWVMQQSGPLARASAIIGSGIGSLLKRDSLLGLFALGMLNGLLPCGLVYLALAAAIAYGDPLSAMTFMAGFGVGTIPVMLGVSLFPRIFSLSIRERLVRLTPVLSIIVGILLIVRGLNLGIPYVSPKLQPVSAEAEQECCH